MDKMRVKDSRYLIKVARHVMGELGIKSIEDGGTPETIRFCWQKLIIDKIRPWSPETKGRIISYSLRKGQIDTTSTPVRSTPRHITDRVFATHGKLVEEMMDGNDFLNHLVQTTLMATIWDILVDASRDSVKK